VAPAKEHGGLIVATPTPNAPAQDAPPKARKHTKDKGKTCAGDLGVWLGSLRSPEKASQFGPDFVLQMGCESTQPRFRAEKVGLPFRPSAGASRHQLQPMRPQPPKFLLYSSTPNPGLKIKARQDQLHAVLQPSISDCSCRRIQRCAI